MSESGTHPAVAALRASLPRRRVPLAYQLGLILVAIAMVLLPLIYVGLIVAVAYALLLYLDSGLVWFGITHVSFFSLLVFLTPIVAGIILIFFMIKPLFAQRGAAMHPLTLERAQQPHVFEFVDRLCDVVGAPRPRCIAVDCAVNASAGFEGGYRDLISGDLALTIGLPLVAGLDIRGLAGVLAHEFGHFAQGTGMRLSYVIRSVNGWFARVVYERDAWDERLEEWSGRADLRIGIMLHVARFCVWITRWVLWALMMVGHGISCFMQRQMEFDADRYEALLIGAPVFESVLLRGHILNVVSGQAAAILAQSWEVYELPENITEMILQLAAEMPAEDQAAVDQQLRSAKTGLFDTHPSVAERIARVQAESVEGIFGSEAPAATLFLDFKALARTATLEYYRAVLGELAEQAQLIPVAGVVEDHVVLRDQIGSLERVFREFSNTLRPVWLPRELDTIDDWQTACGLLQSTRHTMDRGLKDAVSNYVVCAKQEDRRIKAVGARTLLAAEVLIDPGSFGLEVGDLEEAGMAIADAEYTQARAATEIDPFLASAGEWLGLAIRLLAHPLTAEKVGPALTGRDMRPFVEAFRYLQDGHDAYLLLREEFFTLITLAQARGTGSGDDRISGELNRQTAQLRGTLGVLRERLAAAYPFRLASGPVTIGFQVVGAEIADGRDLGALIAQAGTAVQRYEFLYIRLLACLSHTAETLERELGFQPVPKQWRWSDTDCCT